MGYIPKESKDLVIGFVDREHNGNEDYLGDDCEHYSADHHEKEVSLVEICPAVVEVIKPIALIHTPRQQLPYPIRQHKEIILLNCIDLTIILTHLHQRRIINSSCCRDILEHRVVEYNIPVNPRFPVLQQILDVVLEGLYLTIFVDFLLHVDPVSNVDKLQVIHVSEEDK